MAAQGIRSSKEWCEPKLGADLVKPSNDLVAKLGPDEFHWGLIELKRGGHPYAALEAEQLALYFGRDSHGTFKAVISSRAPPGLTDGGRAIGGAPTLPREARAALAALGFRVGQRGMRRTRHAGQYAPRLCAARAEILKAAGAGSPPEIL